MGIENYNVILPFNGDGHPAAINWLLFVADSE